MMAKARRTSQRSKATRICGVLPIYLLQSQGEKQQCLSFVYWTIFATLSLIYWPACLILVCMYFNKHCGSFTKKKTNSPLTSSDSLRTSTDFLLTSTDFLLTSTDSLLTSTDPLLTAKFSLGHLTTA